MNHEERPSPPPRPMPAKRKAGRKKFRETRHPVYRGVRERNSGRWVCEVREPHKKSKIWLGTFPTPEMAARAHDVAAVALRGSSAHLNFPDSASELPRPASAAPEDIRCAASEAMKMTTTTTTVFVDEEAMFDMPGLVNGMAEGMMLTPPAMQRGFDWDGVESHMDLSLWNQDF